MPEGSFFKGKSGFDIAEIRSKLKPQQVGVTDSV